MFHNGSPYVERTESRYVCLLVQTRAPLDGREGARTFRDVPRETGAVRARTPVGQGSRAVEQMGQVETCRDQRITRMSLVDITHLMRSRFENCSIGFVRVLRGRETSQAYLAHYFPGLRAIGEAQRTPVRGSAQAMRAGTKRLRVSGSKWHVWD